LDIGTGSGCIPLALKARRPDWNCQGIDVSTEAIKVATENAGRLGMKCHFTYGDVLSETFSLPPASLDILVSNPPYIPPSERDRMGNSTLVYEPDLALFTPENDPLVFYSRIATIGRSALKAGGRLFLETNEFNNQEVAQLLQEGGYTQVQTRQDMQGKERMVSGRQKFARL
jgi:release factor glutamine methyltransferase